MISLTDAGLCRLAIAAGAVPHEQRERWLQQIAVRLAAECGPSTVRVRAHRGDNVSCDKRFGAREGPTHALNSSIHCRRGRGRPLVAVKPNHFAIAGEGARPRLAPHRYNSTSRSCDLRGTGTRKSLRPRVQAWADLPLFHNGDVDRISYLAAGTIAAPLVKCPQDPFESLERGLHRTSRSASGLHDGPGESAMTAFRESWDHGRSPGAISSCAPHRRRRVIRCRSRKLLRALFSGAGTRRDVYIPVHGVLRLRRGGRQRPTNAKSPSQDFVMDCRAFAALGGWMRVSRTRGRCG